MAFKITDDIKLEIKRLNPLRDLLEEYGYKVEPDGAPGRFKTTCPFHQEDTPSFKLYEPTSDHAEDNYHCYGCHAGDQGKPLKILKGSDVIEITDAGADVIGFIMNYEQIPFQEACKRLMTRAGIPIPIENPQLERAKDHVTAANRQYWHNLQKDPDVLKYLHERGLDSEDIDKWRIGLVPQNHAVKVYAGRLAIGLVENHYDPKLAKTVAMAYRTLDNQDPKYINDKNSALFTKGQYIYGLTYAKRAIRRKGYALVVEGYFDTILAHKHGLENTVATCGTAFTEEQMDELRKLTDKLIFWYDGDSAGREAMERSLPGLLERGFSVLFVNSDPFDPAEMIQQFGADKIVHWIAKNAKPALQVIVDRYADHFDTIVNKAKVEALDRILPLLYACKRPADHSVYEAYIKQRFHL